MTFLSAFRHGRAWIAVAALLTFLGGYGVRVLAEGAPTEQPLFYSGTLEVDGALASGEHTVMLELYDAQSGGAELCAVESEAEVENGRFRIDASACADAMRSSADVWVAVAFRDGGGIERAIAGRSKVGAVPYALEADHAKAAAAATGALRTQLQELTDRIAALEGGAPTSTAFHAVKVTQGALAVGATCSPR